MFPVTFYIASPHRRARAAMGDAVTQEAQASGEAAVADGAIIDSREHVVVAQNTPLLARCFLAKPLSVVHAEESEGVLERSLGFWDLFALGFGGTVGRCVLLSLCVFAVSIW